MDAPTCSGVKTEYTAEILAKYQSRCFSPTIGHIRCTCIILLITATKIAKIFQIVIIWNIFEKNFRNWGKKMRSIYHRSPTLQKTSYLDKKARTRQQSAIQAHLYTNCTGDVKKPRRFRPKQPHFVKLM